MKTIICPRCSGHGTITKYNHVEAGLCFKCHGRKVIEVEDNVVDTIKEIREARESEREYINFWNQYKDEIRNDIDWNNYIDLAERSNEDTTIWEERTIRINQYIEYKRSWEEYIDNHMELFNDIDKFKIVLEEFESKHMNRK